MIRSFLLILPPPRSTLFPYTTLFRSLGRRLIYGVAECVDSNGRLLAHHTVTYIRAEQSSGSFGDRPTDRKSTRLNSSHVAISYAVFCLKKKNRTRRPTLDESYPLE